MKAVQFTKVGDAREVLEVVDIPEPSSPAAGHALVETLYSPLNHHDLGFIDGVFGVPPMPAIPGNEGIGRVLAVGDATDGAKVGDVVVFPLLLGAWRERLLIPTTGLAVVPEDLLDQYSMLGSNTPTAGLALSEYVTLEPGSWVAQDAGNGGVGRNVIALAKARGLRTVSVVRRQNVVDELTSAGADIVLVDGPDIAGRITDAVGGAPIRLAIDGVGGDVAHALLETLSDGGLLVSYGSYTGLPTVSDDLTARGITAQRIFVGAFDYATKIVPIITETVPLIQTGDLRIPIDFVFGLDDVKPAVDQLRRGGKVLFKIHE